MQAAFESLSENSDTSFDHYDVYDLDSEPEDEYGKGGYMKMPEEIEIAGRYEIIQKIGWGHGGIIYLSKDLQNSSFVAVKVLKSHRYYRQEFKDELKILKKFPENDKNVVQMLDNFKVEVSEEDHTVAVYELMGVSLYEILKYYKFSGLPIALCRFIGKEILKTLAHFHEDCGIIVGDLRLKNILLPLTTAQLTDVQETGRMKEKLDFSIFKNTETPHSILNKYLGCSFVVESGKKGKNKGKKGKKQVNPKDILKKLNRIGLVNEEFSVKFCNLSNACLIGELPTRDFPSINYSSPEIILKFNYTAQADIWSFACLMFELVTGHYLFEPFKSKGFRKEDDLLGQIRETLGEFELGYLKTSEVYSKYFNEEGKLKHLLFIQEWPLLDLLIEKYYLNFEEAQSFSLFLKDLLRIDPAQRLTAREALEHKWFKLGAKENTHLQKEKIKEVENWVKKRESDYWQACLNDREYKFESRYKS